MKKYVYQIIGLCLLITVSIQSIVAQKGIIKIDEKALMAIEIKGNDAPYQNTEEGYVLVTPFKGIEIKKAIWTVTGEHKIEESSTQGVLIKWIEGGKQTITVLAYTSKGELQGSLTVKVSEAALPPPPPMPVVVSHSCGAVVIRKSGNIPQGVQWYWQGTNANGTSTAQPATNNYTATRTGRYYIRARDLSSHLWSSGNSLYVQPTTSTWYADTDGDGLGDSNTTQIQCTQPAGYVANNEDQCPHENGGGSPTGCIPPISLSNENYIYTITPQIEVTDINQLRTNKDALKNVTYFDGLGRTKQTVAIKQSTSGKDIIIHTDYDDYSRQTKNFLPYVSTGVTGAIQPNAEAATKVYYKAQYAGDFIGIPQVEINPYSEKVFENSPLNRVIEQTAPGEDWKKGGGTITGRSYSDGHTIKIDYGHNTTQDAVKLYTVLTSFANNRYTPSLAGGTSDYPAGELYKTITKDENWVEADGNLHTTEEFKNKKGQVILKRTYALTDLTTLEGHDTYYIYDDFDNLTYVLSPGIDTSDGISNIELDQLSYQYIYDHRNRLVEKKIPGKGWESIVYDKLDRPVMTQDARQAPNKQWLFTKYDALGRVAYTGKYIHSTVVSQSAMQSLYNSSNHTAEKLYESRVTLGTGIQGSYYENLDFPNTNIEVYAVHYYDNYNFNLAGSVAPPGIDYFYGVTNSPNRITTSTQGLATGSRVKVLGQSEWITTITYYDHRARPVYVYSKNEYLNTTDVVQSKIDFAGKVLETTSLHTKTDNTQATITIVDTFTYDHAARLLKQTQKVNNNPVEVIVNNTYDELGQLQSKRVGGRETDNDGLQTVDYSYNVRGWLKKINEDAQDDNDLFNFSLQYNDPVNATALYNGNISQISWNTASINNTGNPVSNVYSYSYDALNRITGAIDNTGNYNLDLVQYDKNGNITRLVRQGHLDANAGSFGVMDNLSYTYNANSNQLRKVLDTGNTNFGFKDGANLPTAEYTYDVNGNMVFDANKGITSIEYNHLNLPTKVFLGQDRIEYVYDATGVKLMKSVVDISGFGSSTTTNTANTVYAGNYIYETASVSQGFNYTEVDKGLQFFNHPEGYVKYDAALENFDYVYQYKDHLGNVRLSYADSDGDGIIDASSEIIEENAYYPFGMKIRGFNNVVSSNGNSVAQKFGYNGKELEESLDLNTLDLGARHMDPALGRFMTIDPMADFINFQSPYALANNNPVQNIDHYGLGIWDWFRRLFGGRRLKCGVRAKKERKPRIRRGKTSAQRKRERQRRRNKRKRRRQAKNSSNPSTPSNTQSRNSVDPLTINPFGPISIGPNIGMPEITPRTPAVNPPSIPEFRGNAVTPDNPVNINTDVKFIKNTSTFRSQSHTEKTLRDLIMTLKEYPQLRVLILGNFVNPAQGINQETPVLANGQRSTIGGLQLARARAIEQFLINNGIDWRRIVVGNGRILPAGQDNMNSNIIISNPN